MPGDDVRPHHMTAEAVTGKSVAAKAGVPAEATVPASAAMTATAAVTAPAAMCDGAGRPNRCAERNGRGERNGHLQPHESLTSLSSVVGSLVAPRKSPDCDRGWHAMPLTISIGVPSSPRRRSLRASA